MARTAVTAPAFTVTDLSSGQRDLIGLARVQVPGLVHLVDGPQEAGVGPDCRKNVREGTGPRDAVGTLCTVADLVANTQTTEDLVFARECEHPSLRQPSRRCSTS